MDEAEALLKKLVNYRESGLLAPLTGEGFHKLAEQAKGAKDSSEVLSAIVRYMHEQAVYMEHIRDHVQNLVNHTSVLTERLVGLQNEVRSAVRGEPSQTATSKPDDDPDKSKIH